jgi:hypothetical protein
MLMTAVVAAMMTAVVAAMMTAVMTATTVMTAVVAAMTVTGKRRHRKHQGSCYCTNKREVAKHFGPPFLVAS